MSAEALAELAASNAAAARQVVAAAAAEGRQPALADLLVEPSWKKILGPEFSKPYMRQLEAALHKEWSQGVTVYPAKEAIFRALNSVPFHQVRVVILGQDPYFNPGEACGLAFAVERGVRPPSSLRNIYKELASDVGASPPGHGDLSSWCAQGVLLLNAALTVRAGSANSHAGLGWHTLTGAVVAALGVQRTGLVFLLWGRWAQGRAEGVSASRHHLLKSPHPSGLSAARGFFGCRHFSKANQLLQRSGLPPIHWQIPAV